MSRAARVVTAAVLLAAACSFDPAYRDAVDTKVVCADGVVECRGALLTVCEQGSPKAIDDCGARGQACAPALLKCTPCLPGDSVCDGADVLRCEPTGQTRVKEVTCDGAAGIACRRGVCTHLCSEAQTERSNVGCEYWAVDLDNAVTAQGNAAAQQFAVVVSNPQPDLPAKITVEDDVAAVGQPAAPRVVGTAIVRPRNLEVFKLGPKEVDGSPPGRFDEGTHTALTRGAYRVSSDVPIVAYQFNPLENANVFSNDASLLLPTEALGGGGLSYVIAGWPQTIAISENPAQNFGANLRAFLAIVGTRPDTRVKVKTTARVVAGGPLAAGAAKGADIEVTLQPYEVLNLETGDFNADFTGTTVESSEPVAVFPGSEASDAPVFQTLASRSCCADHLEEQGIPLRAAGKRYVLGRVPNRSRAVAAAGGAVAPFDEPEYYRIVATRTGTRITTTLPPPLATIDLPEQGSNVIVAAYKDFLLSSNEPVIVADVQASQEAAGVERGLPGGDPSLTFVPPVEQWRSDYVLLTPDKYAFDFLIITARFGASVFVDGLPVDGKVCEVADADGQTRAERGGRDPEYVVYRCQLSFPVIDPDKVAPANLTPGRQNDGVHRVQSDLPVGVLVYGFDAFVSYAYAGGTELRDLVPK